MGPWIACACVAAPCAVLSLCFHLRKGSFLIAGYNTAGEKERAELDTDKLYRYMARFMAFHAAIWALMGLFSLWWEPVSFAVGISIELIGTIAFIIWINSGGRIRKP